MILLSDDIDLRSRRVPEKLGRLCGDVAAIFVVRNNLVTLY